MRTSHAPFSAWPTGHKMPRTLGVALRCHEGDEATPGHNSRRGGLRRGVSAPADGAMQPGRRASRQASGQAKRRAGGQGVQHARRQPHVFCGPTESSEVFFGGAAGPGPGTHVHAHRCQRPVPCGGRRQRRAPGPPTPPEESTPATGRKLPTGESPAAIRSANEALQCFPSGLKHRTGSRSWRRCVRADRATIQPIMKAEGRAEGTSIVPRARVAAAPTPATGHRCVRRSNAGAARGILGHFR